MKKSIILIILAIVIILAIGGWFLFLKKSAENKTAQGDSLGFGGQIFNKIEQNTAEKIPDVNPFQQVKNPYEEAYSNPFE